LQLLEQRSETGEIDLYYGDETQISEEGYVPYGWQFKGENIAVKSGRLSRINCFGIITRDNSFVYQTTAGTITADFVIEQLDRFSLTLKKHTVIVLDNARVHRCHKMTAMQRIWARRKLFIFFLPPYSPQLNIIERLWKEIKARWISVRDYGNQQQLFYSVDLILRAIGRGLKLHFKPMKLCYFNSY